MSGELRAGSGSEEADDMDGDLVATVLAVVLSGSGSFQISIFTVVQRSALYGYEEYEWDGFALSVVLAMRLLAFGARCQLSTLRLQ